MAGELWRNAFQIGLESAVGAVVAPVPATRKLYLSPEAVLSSERDAHIHRYSVGRRDNVLAYTNGPVKAGGSGSIAFSAEESLELLSMGVGGSPIITTPSGATLAQLHTYKPGALALATMEWNDGARNWQGRGYCINQLTIDGAVDGELTMAAEFFGTNLVTGTATTGLTDRTPTIVESWQTRVYIEAFNGTPGATVVTGLLTNWTVTVNNNLDRLATADNTLAFNRVVMGMLDVTASLTVDAASPAALAEFANWQSGAGRLVRLEFQDETGFIEGALRRFITVDVPGNWTATNLGASGNGVRKYELSLQSVYQTTLAAMLQVRVQCARVSGFA